MKILWSALLHRATIISKAVHAGGDYRSPLAGLSGFAVTSVGKRLCGICLYYLLVQKIKKI